MHIAWAHVGYFAKGRRGGWIEGLFYLEMKILSASFWLNIALINTTQTG